MYGKKWGGRVVLLVVLFISLSAAAIAGVSDKFAGGETKDTGQMDVTSADRAFGGARNAAVEETNISLSSGGAGAIFGGGLSTVLCWAAAWPKVSVPARLFRAMSILR